MGLHPLQGDDRHRRRDVGSPAQPRDGPARRRKAASTSTRCASGSRRSSGVCSESIVAAARAARASGCSTAPARLKGPHEVVVETADGVEELEADAVLVATGSRPRIPDWATVDGERVLTTRERVPAARAAGAPRRDRVRCDRVSSSSHMFSSFGSKVTLIVSRQQVLPAEGPRGRGRARGRVPAPGRHAAQGRPGDGHRARRRRRCVVRCDDGRVVPRGRTRCWPSARSRTREGLGLDAAGVDVDDGGYVPINHHCQIERAAHLRRRRRVREAAAVVGRGDAGPQDRRARDGPAHPSPTATSTTTRRRRRSSPSPRSPTSGWPRPRRSPSGRKIRVTKVPFSAIGQGADQRRPARVREDRLRPGDRRRARRVDRRAPRRRAHLA